MGDPSRPVDDIALLRSALALVSGLRAKLSSAPPALADLDALARLLDELLARSATRETARAIAGSASGGTPGGHETILVVEDNETILTLVTNALSRLGYHVLSASDGPSALERFGTSPDDIKLLVTDVMMPRMSGRELAAHMTALRPRMKVLYASGYTQDAMSQQGAFDTDVNFIMKPFTPQGLAARIRQLLDASAS